MLSWLLLSLEKQKGWKEMVIPLHLRISNKNLLQPPACLQDFLFCLTTSIFKLAKLLCQELPQPPSPLRSHPGYVSSYAVLLVLFYDFWWGVPPVPWLCGSDWHEEVKGETCPHLPACLQATEHTAFCCLLFFFPLTSYLCSYFKYNFIFDHHGKYNPKHL